MQAIKLAIGVLNSRLLLLLTLLAAGGLSYLSVAAPDTPRLIAAGIFDAAVLWPIVWVYAMRG